MLTTVERVLRVPGLNNPNALPLAWMNDLVGDADAGIKRYLKRDIELTAYDEFYSGNEQQDVISRQFPILIGQTTIAASSGGQTLPQGTINVASTVGFHPGYNVGSTGSLPPDLILPSLAVQVSASTWVQVQYTGTTPTSFTGCTGGTGSLVTGNRVYSPVVFYDPIGYGGQSTGGFGAGTILVPGSNYYVKPDGGGGSGGTSFSGKSAGRKSARGLIRRIGGSGQGFVGFWPETYLSGKLGARRLPCWPRGEDNVHVLYSAGYSSADIPLDIANVATQLVAFYVRNMPQGAVLQSESLGAYSYSVLTQQTDVPEIGSIARTLGPYRDISI